MVISQLFNIIRTLILRRFRVSRSLDSDYGEASAIINGTPSLVVGITPGGLTNFVNPAVEMVTGYKKSELIGKNWWTTMYPGEAYSQVEKLFEDIAAGNVRDYEMTLQTKSGEKRIVAWNSLNRFDHHNNLIEVVGFGNDLTDRIRAEEKLKVQSMVSATSNKMSALGGMAAGMAHEINTPLSTLLLLCDKLGRDISAAPLDKSKASRDLQLMKSTVLRIDKIIKGLKSFSRNGEQDEFIRIPLLSVVEDTLTLCGDKFKVGMVEVEIDPRLREVTVECQVVQLSQVLLNLLNNSYDALEHLEEKWVKITVDVDSHFVVLSVIDSGRGISPDVIEKMMNPFYTTKEIGKGTGLGLSVSQGIIEHHHGQLHYDRSQEHTTFRIKLPKKHPLSKLKSAA